MATEEEELQGFRKFNREVASYMTMLKENVPPIGTVTGVPAIVTKRDRFPPVLVAYLAKTEGIYTGGVLKRNPVLGYASVLSDLLGAVSTGDVSDTRTLGAFYDDRDVKGRYARQFSPFLFDVLYGSLQMYSYFYDENAVDLFMLSCGLVYSVGEGMLRRDMQAHVDHFRAHASLFLSAASRDQAWPELLAQAFELVSSWGDHPLAEPIFVHAAHNLDISCRGLPESDAAYELVRGLRHEFYGRAESYPEVFDTINGRVGWQTGSEVLKVLWWDLYRKYYEYTRERMDGIAQREGPGRAVEEARRIGFVSPGGIPYLKRTPEGERGEVYLSFPGGSRIGRTSVLLRNGGIRVLLDYGMDQYNRTPLWSPDIDMVDAIVISHAHRDHIGGLLDIYGIDYFNGRWYALKETRELADLALRDTIKIKRLEMGGESPYSEDLLEYIMSKFTPVRFGEKTAIGDGFSAQPFPAGHVHGSCQYLIEAQGTAVFYTGDFNTRFAQSVRPMELPDEEARARVSALIMEGTYAFREEDILNAEEAETSLLGQIRNAPSFPVLLPVLSLGRAQEVLAILSGTEYRVGVFGLARKISIVAGMHYDDNIRFDPRNPDLVERGEYDVIVASSGCLQGGPSKYFFGKKHWNVTTILTGYVFPGTPARALTGELGAVRFSAHTPHSDGMAFMGKFPNADRYLIHYPGGARIPRQEHVVIPSMNREYRVRRSSEVAAGVR